MEDLRRFLPKSLVGQIALVMALALLVAQSVNFALILSDRQRLSFAEIEAPAISRFVTLAVEVNAMPPDRRAAFTERGLRRNRFWVSGDSVVAAGTQRDPNIETRLRRAATENGLASADLRAAVDRDIPRRAGRENVGRDFQLLLLSARLSDGSWLNGRVRTPRPDPWLAARLAGATLLVYLIVLGAMVWVAARLGRPLRDLAAAAARFDARSVAPRVDPRGPADLRRAIEAFNDMNGRVTAMLDEKDRMLGAIGHDLRTPLASLRIRAESLEPEEERQKIIATIEEMTSVLDDTLVLARSGRSREPARPMDLTALADALVEDFAEAGQPVELLSSGREVACVRPNLLRRALRNLIDNAVKYGGSASVQVAARGPEVEIEISDRGPGIPEDQLGHVLEPFHRLEASRNRETGGSGLGLTIARAVALNHGGRLELENREGGGLSVRLVLPRE